MKVLVTGGAGFIGSHVVELLTAHNYLVSVLDNLSTGSVSNLPCETPLYQVDLTDHQAVRQVLKTAAPDYLIHHAAQVDVGTSVADPIMDAATNILASINLFQAAYQLGVKRIVYASSAAVYGNPSSLPLPEESAIEPLSPYGISKYTPEHYLRYFAAQAGAGYTVLRYANVYGPRQNASGEGGVVAIFASRLADGRPVSIFGDGRQTRDFIYVADVARANLAAVRSGVDGVFNVSTGRRVSVNELFSLLKHVAGAQAECLYAPARSGEIRHSSLDPQKAQACLDWEALTNLAEGITQTYRWFAGLRA